jgi:hypothetical protein
MALNRRFKSNFQGGITYTYMFSMHDDGTIGYTAPGQNNQFDYLNGENANSTDLQNHTLRLWTLYRFPLGITGSVSYFYGSGQRFAATIAGAPYGKPGTNRLNLTAAGGPTSTIVVPATATLLNGDVIDIASRFEGNATIASGETIPRDALVGLPLHKVDLRLTKDIKLVGTTKISLIGEVYNLFNHHNYGSYNLALSATAPATTALFGTPTQNIGNAYVPRQAQFAFRLSF